MAHEFGVVLEVAPLSGREGLFAALDALGRSHGGPTCVAVFTPCRHLAYAPAVEDEAGGGGRKEEMRTAVWQKGGGVGRWKGRKAEWQNGRKAEWQKGRMAEISQVKT